MESQPCTGAREVGRNDESIQTVLDMAVNSQRVRVFCKSSDHRSIYRPIASGLSQADHETIDSDNFLSFRRNDTCMFEVCIRPQ